MNIYIHLTALLISIYSYSNKWGLFLHMGFLNLKQSKNKTLIKQTAYFYNSQNMIQEAPLTS